MAYLFRQKLKISDLVVLEQNLQKILLAEAEEYRSALYSQYLSSETQVVLRCGDLYDLAGQIRKHSPHLLVLSVEMVPGFTRAVSLLRRLRSDYPGLQIVTLGHGLDADEVKQLMGTGVCGHVDRRFSRPQDLAEIVRTILASTN